MHSSVMIHSYNLTLVFYVFHVFKLMGFSRVYPSSTIRVIILVFRFILRLSVFLELACWKFGLNFARCYIHNSKCWVYCVQIRPRSLVGQTARRYVIHIITRIYWTNHVQIVFRALDMWITLWLINRWQTRTISCREFFTLPPCSWTIVDEGKFMFSSITMLVCIRILRNQFLLKFNLRNLFCS